MNNIINFTERLDDLFLSEWVGTVRSLADDLEAAGIAHEDTQTDVTRDRVLELTRHVESCLVADRRAANRDTRRKA